MDGQNGSLSPLQIAKRKAVEKWLKPAKNVIGVGLGKKKLTSGLEVDCVRIYVVNKMADQDLISPAELIKKNWIDPDVGAPTDVIQVGRLGRSGRDTYLDHDTTTRPGSRIRLKTEAPNVNEGARGTLGTVVTTGNNDKYILGCNHVIAANGRVHEGSDRARIVSGELADEKDEIANPGKFVELLHTRANSVDCAIAQLTDAKVKDSFPDVQGGPLILKSEQPGKPEVNMNVSKFGAGTGLTRGTIVDIDADLYVDYSFGTFLFENQVIIEGSNGADFATKGDSGSIVINDRGEAVAMVFAASGQHAVACPLSTVLTELGDELGRPLHLVVPETKASVATQPSSSQSPAA